MKRTSRIAGLLALVAAGLATPALGRDDGDRDDRVLRAGMIGLDTSHVIAFTRILNDPDAEGPLARVRVVAGFPGGSPDVEASASRVEGFTAQLRDEFGVEIVGSIQELLEKVDVVFLESVDGRPHLEQARPVIAAGTPLFIDKPVAGSLADAVAIFRLAEEAGVTCFSTSSLRFSPEVAALAESPPGEMVGAMTFGPCHLETHHPDLYWYGVHGVEALYTLMGPGCEVVRRTHTEGTDVVTGVWSDGRVGTFRGLRDGRARFGGVAFGTEGPVPFLATSDYRSMLVEVCRVFAEGAEPPVTAEETIELFAFMTAADESKRRDGAPVRLDEVLRRTRQEAGVRSR